MIKNDKVQSRCVDYIHRDTIDNDMPNVKNIYDNLGIQTARRQLTKVSLLAYIVS